MKNKNIILFGLRNSGKTTVGKFLSNKLGYHFIDTDILIEKLHLKIKNEHLSYIEIYNSYGQTYFKKLEKEAVSSLIADQSQVISLGGSTALDIPSRPHLQALGFLIYLKIDFKTFLKRNSDNRPPFCTDKSEKETCLRKIYNERTAIFNLFNSFHIKADLLNIEEIVKEIQNVIK